MLYLIHFKDFAIIHLLKVKQFDSQKLTADYLLLAHDLSAAHFQFHIFIIHFYWLKCI